MEARKATILDIFNGSRVLEIPFFQRAYVWDEPQWDRLLEDLRTVCKTRKPFFIGSLILKQQPTSSVSPIGDMRSVVDGQQRLTTLSIILKVLCMKAGAPERFDKRFRLDDGRTVLQHNWYNISAYHKVMDLKSLEELEGEDNITRCYQYFSRTIDPQEIDFDTIGYSVLFVGIDLAPDEDEQQIFDTINSLGVNLTTAELLKNYFFGRNDVKAYEEYWVPTFERDDDTLEYWDQEIITSRTKRSFIDIFFYAFLQIQIQDTRFAVKSEDKIAFSRQDKLFESYKRFISEYCDGNHKTVLRSIKDYAHLFRTIIKADVLNAELPASPGLKRLNAIVFALDTTTLIPYLLFVEYHQRDIQVRRELYAYLESYLLRRIVVRASTRGYSQLFTERLILNRVLTRQEFATYIERQDDRTNRIPTDVEVMEAFQHSWLTNKYALGVLYMLETRIRNRKLHSTQMLGISKYSLEHIMPKSWQKHWGKLENPEEEEKRDRALQTLGNLTIITQALNSTIRDAAWQTKKVGQGTRGGLQKYAEGLETLSAYLEADVWDEKMIAQRAEGLAKRAIEVWYK